MRKDTKNLRGGFRGFAAAVIVASLAVFGCTTNRTPGDGEPSTTPPIMPSATPGSW